MNIGSAFSRAKLNPSPNITNEWIQERLNSVLCRSLEEGQQRTFGLVPYDKPERGEHYGMEHSKGEYTVFRFMKLRRQVPSSVLRMKIREEVEKYRKAGTRPNKHVMVEIRQRMEAQLLAQAFPVPTGFPVIWNTRTGRIVLGTTSAALLDEFFTCFEKGFQGFPQMLFHVRWALDALSGDDRQKDRLKAQFEWETPFAINDSRRLGYDFLTWLWFFCESEKTLLHEGKKVALQMLERLVLVKPDDRSDRVTCITKNNMLPEAREALRQGKVVDEAHVYIGIDADNGGPEYELALDSTLRAIKSIKLPPIIRDTAGEQLAEDGLFLERMYHIEQIQAVLDELYRQFLLKRLSPTWDRSIQQMIHELFAREAA